MQLVSRSGRLGLDDIHDALGVAAPSMDQTHANGSGARPKSMVQSIVLPLLTTAHAVRSSECHVFAGGITTFALKMI